MKKVVSVLLFLASFANLSFAAERKSSVDPILGTWKYTRQSASNSFKEVAKVFPALNYTSEYFVFEDNHKFRHEFKNEAGATLKVLKGKWKSMGDKIKIDYTTINYDLTISYFFLDKDLVLGQNFNHVIFKKDDPFSQNTALK